MNLKEKAIEGSVFNSIRGVLESAVALGAFLLFARWLSPDAFGVYAIAASFTAFAKSVQDLGFSTAIIQFEEIDDGGFSTAFWTVAGVGVLLTLGLWGISPVVAYGFGMPEAGSVLRWLSLGVLLHGFTDAFRATLNRDIRFLYLGVCSVLATVFGAIAGLYMAYVGHGVWSLVGYQLIITLTGTIGFTLGSHRMPGLSWRPGQFREMCDFGLPVIGKKIVKRIGERTDDILIGFFFTSTILGYYVVAYRILKISRQLLVRTFINVAIPVFSRLQNERERLKQVFLRAIRMTSFVAVPALLGLALLAPELIRLLFGSKWGPSTPILRILIGAGMIDSVLLFHTPLLVAVGHTKRDLYLTLVKTGLLVALFLSTVQIHIHLVAGAYVTATLLLLPLAYRMIRDVVDVVPVDYVGYLLPSVWGSLGVLTGVVTYWRLTTIDYDVYGVLAGVGAGLLGYLITTGLLARDSLKELYGLGQTFFSSQEGSGEPLLDS